MLFNTRIERWRKGLCIVSWTLEKCFSQSTTPYFKHFFFPIKGVTSEDTIATNISNSFFEKNPFIFILKKSAKCYNSVDLVWDFIIITSLVFSSVKELVICRNWALTFLTAVLIIIIIQRTTVSINLSTTIKFCKLIHLQPLDHL